MHVAAHGGGAELEGRLALSGAVAHVEVGAGVARDRRQVQPDLRAALDAARELRVPLPSAAAADELLTVARALGYERRDIAALFEVLKRMAGVGVND